MHVGRDLEKRLELALSASQAAGIPSSFIFDQAMQGRLILVLPNAPRQSMLISTTSSVRACLSLTSSINARISQGRRTAAILPPEGRRVSLDRTLAPFMGKAGERGSTPSSSPT